MADLWSRIKTALFYVAFPIWGLAVVIYLLWNKTRNLEDELETSKSGSELQKILSHQQAVDDAANSATDDYERVRKAYLSGSDSEVRPSPSGEGQAGGDPKPGA